MFVMDEDGTPRLRMCVGLKKYTMDPSSMSSKLFGHWYCFVGDVDDGQGEINKFDWDYLQISGEINVYKEKHHKKILEENPTKIIIDPVGEDDAQQETIRVRNAMFFPYCLMPLVLDKELNPREAFLLLEATISAGNLSCCQGVLDFCRVGGTLANVGDTKPRLARDTAGNITAVSIDRPLQRFMRKKVLERDLKGLIQGTTQTDPVIQELTNAVTAFTDAHIATDAANEA